MMSSRFACLVTHQCNLRSSFLVRCVRKSSQCCKVFNHYYREPQKTACNNYNPKIVGHYGKAAVVYNHLRYYGNVGQQSALDNEEEREESHSDLFRDLGPEDERKLKILQLEYDVWFSMGYKVPQVVTDAMWLQLLKECQSVSSRRKMFAFWMKREKMREMGRRRKEENRKKRELEDRVDVDPSEPYANRLFQKYTKSKMNEILYFNNLVFAMVHGPHLVFDLGFQDHMMKRELTNLVDQLSVSHGYNNIQKEPFHFHFCNVHQDSTMEKILYKRFIGLDNVPYTVTDKSYLDCYPRANLVYLSPNAPTIMKEFDHNDIYILGGIVDKAGQEPLTFAKAKREGIRCMKLPLDKYLQWNIGSKALTLDQMVKIMEKLKSTKSNWTEALQHVPKRKFTWR